MVYIFLLFFSVQAFAENNKIQFIWTGVSGIKVTDGQTTLLFDTVFTKPGFQHWLLNFKFKSNTEVVKSGLSRASIQKADAIFASHEHFDHAVDILEVARQTKAVIYGGPSLEKIYKAENDPTIQFRIKSHQQVLQIGLFKVIGFKHRHPPILQALNWRFLPGEIRDSFNFNFYDYREGDVWSYRVEHPLGRFLFDQSSHFSTHNDIYRNKTDIYFLGVANKVSLYDLVENNIKIINPSIAVATHFDLFFLQSKFLESLVMPGTQLSEISQSIHNSNATGSTKINFQVPIAFEPLYYP